MKSECVTASLLVLHVPLILCLVMPGLAGVGGVPCHLVALAARERCAGQVLVACAQGHLGAPLPVARGGCRAALPLLHEPLRGDHLRRQPPSS